MDFVSFPSIEGFHNVVKLTKSYPHLAGKPVKYKGKIKIHGGNAAITIHNGEVKFQSRTQFVDEKNDNAGFARWANLNKEYWSGIKSTEQTTIFGEWCGPGIQKGTAINNIPNKIFAVFAVMIGGAEIDVENNNPIISEPDEIKAILGNLPKDVYILPWINEEENTIDFLQDDLQVIADYLNDMVNKTEPSDPWVKETFNVDGIAEGIVYYPSVDSITTRKMFSDFAFKAKGDKHKVVKTKEAVQVDPEVAATINEFVDMFVTEARIEQGASVVSGFEMKNVGNFLKWINTDIKKESVDELEASNLTWDDVQSAVQNTARIKFVAEAKKV